MMSNPILNILRNKIVISFFLIVLFLLLIITMLRRSQQYPAIQTPVQNQTRVSPTIQVIPTVPTTNTFVISGVTVKNFYKNQEDSNNVNDVLFFENADYSMTYAASFEQFYISIKNTDFLSVRVQAEKKFLELLGINETDACTLTVEESVPLKSESVYAGGVYNLSFCDKSLN